MFRLTVTLASWTASSGHSYTGEITHIQSAFLGKIPSHPTLLRGIRQLPMTLSLLSVPHPLSAYFQSLKSIYLINSSSSYVADTTPSSTRKPSAKIGCIARCGLQNTTSRACGSTPLRSKISSFSLGSFSGPYWTFMRCSNSSKSSTPSWTPLHQNPLVRIPCGWSVSQRIQKSVRQCTLLEFLCGFFTTKNISLR